MSELSKEDLAAQLAVLLEDEIRFREMVIDLVQIANRDENQERRLNWLGIKLNRCELEQEVLRNALEDRRD